MPELTLNSNIGLYRSGVTSPKRLRRTSVVREHLLDNAIESLRGSVGRKSKNHLLFIGPRGIGKTHLLSCIEDAVQSDETLSASVVIVRFPEESNRDAVLRRFPDWHVRDIEGGPRRRTAVDGAVCRGRDRRRRRQGCRHAGARNPRRESQGVAEPCSLCSKTWARSLPGKSATRAMLPPCASFSWPTTAACCWPPHRLHFDGITDVGQPFYDFFDVQILENLSFEETVEVIRLNLEWEERTDILETLDDMRPRLQAPLSHDGGKPAADDDALRVDRPRVGHQCAGSIPPAARPHLAVLSGPTE